MAGQALEGLLFASIDVLRVESAAVATTATATAAVFVESGDQHGMPADAPASGALHKAPTPQVVENGIMRYRGSSFSDKPARAYECNVVLNPVLPKGLFEQFCATCQLPFVEGGKIVRGSTACVELCGRWVCYVCQGILDASHPYIPLTKTQEARAALGVECPQCTLCASCHLPLNAEPSGCDRPRGCRLWFHPGDCYDQHQCAPVRKARGSGGK